MSKDNNCRLLNSKYKKLLPKMESKWLFKLTKSIKRMKIIKTKSHKNTKTNTKIKIKLNE